MPVKPPSRSARNDDLGVLLNGQSPSRQAQCAGWPALAQALLACAVLDSGLLPRRGPVAQRDAWSARNYLLEADRDRDVPLPLELACAWVGLDPDRVRAIARLRLP